jgi:hypothetical protein
MSIARHLNFAIFNGLRLAWYFSSRLIQESPEVILGFFLVSLIAANMR